MQSQLARNSTFHGHTPPWLLFRATRRETVYMQQLRKLGATEKRKALTNVACGAKTTYCGPKVSNLARHRQLHHVCGLPHWRAASRVDHDDSR